MHGIPWEIVGVFTAALIVLVIARKVQTIVMLRKRLTCSVCHEKVATGKDLRAKKHPRSKHSMMDCEGVGQPVLERPPAPRAVPKAA